MTPGQLYLSRIGYDEAISGMFNSISTFAMAALNAGWAARFMAQDTRDVYSVWINWSVVTAAGTVQVRIETVDANSKPSGTLYDANASVNITPAAGWQQATFASHPTTGLTAGTEFAIVLLTTVAGTTMTLRSHITNVGDTVLPTIALTAANGTTRTNFAESLSSNPIASLAMSDGAEEPMGLMPFVTVTTFDVWGTRAFGLKVVLNDSLVVRGYLLQGITQLGSPANLRVRIFDSGNNVVSGSTALANNASLGGIGSTNRVRLLLGTSFTLPAGTYRVVVDQDNHSTTSGNKYTCRAASSRNSGLVPSGLIRTDTTNIDAGPPTWTDTATDQPTISVLLDDLVTPAGGGGAGPFSRIHTGF